MSQIAIFGDLNCRILVTNYSNCLVKDVLRCIRMRQFADFAAQFADFVVTLHQKPIPNALMLHVANICLDSSSGLASITKIAREGESGE